MNDELDSDLQNIFNNDSQEFPVEPFAKNTLTIIRNFDLAFRRVKLFIGFLISLTILIISPWLLDSIAFVSHYIAFLVQTDFFVPVFFCLLACSYLLNRLFGKIKIFGLF